MNMISKPQGIEQPQMIWYAVKINETLCILNEDTCLVEQHIEISDVKISSKSVCANFWYLLISSFW